MKGIKGIRYTKSQRMGIAALVLLLALSEWGIWFLKSDEKPREPVEVPAELIALQQRIDSTPTQFSFYRPVPVVLKNFNPNSLDEDDWQKLGFSPKQAAVILKYKQSLGGRFSSRQELKECFVISESKFQELEPYLLLPQFSDKKSIVDFKKPNPKTKIHYRQFNPNDYSKEDWMAIGFSDKQAATILKYRKSLGGKFTSMAQIQKCFVISEEKFAEMKLYMVFPEPMVSVEENNSEPQPPVPSTIQKFNPNDLTREQWMELGFSEKQVNTIFNYKKSLGGKFKDAATLQKCYSISDEKFAEIEPYLTFD